jgi:hypothetical protein
MGWLRTAGRSRWLRVAGTGIGLLLLVRGINIGEAGASLAHADPRLELLGIVVTAAGLACAVGAWAVAVVWRVTAPPSSGKTQRHRLNRGGDRQGNTAHWRIAFTRMNCDPRTRASVARRTSEGLSKREILRCLKRYIAREVFQVLPRPLT